MYKEYERNNTITSRFMNLINDSCLEPPLKKQFLMRVGPLTHGEKSIVNGLIYKSS